MNISEILDNVSVKYNKASSQYHVDINCKLSTKEYQMIKKLFNAYGGEWNRQKETHIFVYDPTKRLDEVRKSGVMPNLNPNAFFPTPKETCINLFEDAISSFYTYLIDERTSDLKILEPSAGSGNFLDALREVSAIGKEDMEYFNQVVDCIDIDIENIRTLQGKGYDPLHQDFLTYNTDYAIKYDLIFINPPFSVEGDKKAHITHIQHAYKMLKPDGNLVFIAPASLLSNRDKKTLSFVDEVAPYVLTSSILPRGTFGESGTNVETVAVTLSNHTKRLDVCNGYKNYFVWQMVVYAMHDTDFSSEFDYLCSKRSDRKDFKSLVTSVLHKKRRENIMMPYNLMNDYIDALWGAASEYWEEDDYLDDYLLSDDEAEEAETVKTKQLAFDFAA